MMLDKGMTDWMSTVATSKWMLIALIVLIVIVIVIMTLKKKGRLSVQIQPQKNEPVKSISNSDEKTDQRFMLVGMYIGSTAKSFNGLYEGIYQMAIGTDKANSEALVEWKLRVENMRENDELKKAFSDLFASDSEEACTQAKKLQKCIELAGIKRSEETEYRYELNASKKYICLSGNNLEQGTVCTVIKPYWYIEDKIIEQGCIIRKE